MRYFLRTVVGLGLMIASIVAVSYAVNQLMQIGTCASGGPYVSARQCPPGTERIGLAIPVSIIGLLVGAFLYGGRGTAPGADRPGDFGAAVGVLWAGLFLGIAFACFWGVWGPDASPGSGAKTGGLIVGFLFVPMGLGGLLTMVGVGKTMHAAGAASPAGLGTAVKTARGARRTDFNQLVAQMERQAAANAPSANVASSDAGDGEGDSDGDAVSKLERLDRLRQSGAIDAGEFEAMKKKVIARGDA